MDRQDPRFHGYSHRPGGSDPIPGLGGGGLPYIAGYANGLGPLASGAGFSSDFVTSGTWTSSDTSIFDPTMSNVDFVLVEGAYLFLLSLVYIASPGAAIGSPSTLRGRILPNGPEFDDTSTFQNDRVAGGVRSTHHVIKLGVLTPANVPGGFSIGLSQESGVDCTYSWDFGVVRINPTPTATPV